jgi:hypothetical protein
MLRLILLRLRAARMKLPRNPFWRDVVEAAERRGNHE